MWLLNPDKSGQQPLITVIKNNIKKVLKNINRALEKTGNTSSVKLVAVTKTVPADRIKEALDCGITDIGENRIQEAERKFEELSLAQSIKKHLIGHLQTNKVKKAVEMFDVIQSVDSIYLAEEINKRAGQINKIQECLVEIKVSEEETKYGLHPDKLPDFLEKAKELENIKIIGLMVMAPFFEDPEQTRPYFRRAYGYYSSLVTRHSLSYLSMGMTNDYEVAVEEGSNMVRIGTGIFK
ncbi:MAG: YggS family pyridoxal phosphate-dependent enzyme [Elusimicrobia bacterium]|nr:YggS family pyridoxal phosphate-dependent enzyme [Elusimicrobiota bacterium]